MKQWILENILQSRTAWVAVIAFVAGTLAWIFALPVKDLAAVGAYFAFLGVVFGGWVTANKVQSNIDNAGAGK